MSDLISKSQSLIEWKEDFKDFVEGLYILNDDYKVIMTYIDEVPSAEPRKKGRWQWCGNHHLCSECDEWALTRWDEDECDEVDILTDFCPNCGSYNGGEEE